MGSSLLGHGAVFLLELEALVLEGRELVAKNADGTLDNVLGAQCSVGLMVKAFSRRRTSTENVNRFESISIVTSPSSSGFSLNESDILTHSSQKMHAILLATVIFRVKACAACQPAPGSRPSRTLPWDSS